MSSGRTIVREILAITGKEILEFRRQPGALFLVVIGPFLVLAAFGLGYRNEELSLRTVFVGPSDSPYEEAIGRYTDSIDQYVVPVAFTTDLFAASEDLRRDRADLVVVLPPNVPEAISEGRRSEIAVLHNSIDPIERIGIEFAAEVAVRELNATVVTSTLAALLDSVDRLDEQGGSLTPGLLRLERALVADDDAAVALAVLELRQALAQVEPVLNLSVEPNLGSGGELDGGGSEDGSQGEGRNRSRTLGDLISRLDELPADADAEDLVEIRNGVEQVDAAISQLLNYEASLLARPFDGDAESLVREFVSAEDHVAPGATALLIQHLTVSLAALSLVRDQRRGLLTAYRVGPTSVASVVLGKLLALSSVATVAAALLMTLQVGLLDVPLRGSAWSVAVILIGLVVASAALGLFIATLFRTELFVSQAAMISLLIALFFSGFLLDLDRILDPIRSIGLVVPSTPAVEALRNVQLRGSALERSTLLVLGIQAALGLIGASGLIAHRWRSGS